MKLANAVAAYPSEYLTTRGPAFAPLFIVGPNGENQLVNYRVNGSYYIVDRMFAAAELRLGEDPQQVVRITRTDGRSPGRPGTRPAGHRTLMDILAGNRGGDR